MRSVLVTGAGGFVGTALCRALVAKGYAVRRALRSVDRAALGGIERSGVTDIVVGDIGPDTRWKDTLRAVDLVVHLAARAHVMDDRSTDPLAAYRLTNVAATSALATAAARSGVQRFVFMSSIKVNGERSGSAPLSESDVPCPVDAYGISKWEAEQAMWESAAATRMECAVLRPPLLYGPGVKGNFLRLMRAIDRGIPLPFASIRNRRSLLYVDNLVDAIILCLDHPSAVAQTYLLADKEDVATPDLVRALATALGRPARLLPFPPDLLELAGNITGKAAAVSRLLGSLQVDSSKIRGHLGWLPRVDLASGLRQTARWHRRHDGLNVIGDAS